jgi:DNA-binding transcriptional ArsR family regulator
MGKDKNVLDCGQSLYESIEFDFYKTLFDPVRSDILVYLACNGKKNIKDISEKFPQDRSVISRHLDLMYRYGIVSKEKQAREVTYEVNSGFILQQFEKTTTNLKKMLQMPSKQAIDLSPIPK